MMIKNLLLCYLMSIVFTLPANAAEAPKIHVHINSVITAGDVRPVDGITSSGQPDIAALEVFAAAGYVAVIDMRGPHEDRGIDEKNVVERLGLDYVELPISGHDAINFENARKLDAMLAGYDGPVLLHCGSGNRVGAILALRHSLSGADDEEALSYGRSAGLTGLEPVVRERFAGD